MLKKRTKRRYVAIAKLNELPPKVILNNLLVRNNELFGSIITELSVIKIYESKYDNILIIGCNFDSLDRILTTVCLIQPSMTAIQVSGTLKRLRMKIAEKYDLFC